MDSTITQTPAKSGPETRRSRRTASSTSSLKRCLFALVPVVTLLTVAEFAARCFIPDSVDSGKRFEQIEQIIVYLGNEPGQSIFEPDPDCFWRLKPNVELPPDRGSTWGGRMSNSHGLRSREVSLQDVQHRRRVLCLGDSSTFSFGVDFSAAWPNQLQEQLDSRSPGEFEILNAGIPGQTTYQGRQRLTRELTKWRPQVALITFGNNDGWRWDGLEDKQHATATPASAALQSLDHSRAWQWLRSSCATSRQAQKTQEELEWASRASQNYFDPNITWTPRVSLDDFANNLQSMIAACRQHDCEPMLIVWPDQRQLLDQPTWRLPYQAAMREVASVSKVQCIDLVPVFESTGLWGIERFIPRDVIHVDRAGNRLVSQVVEPFVLPVAQEPLVP